MNKKIFRNNIIKTLKNNKKKKITIKIFVLLFLQILKNIKKNLFFAILIKLKYNL